MNVMSTSLGSFELERRPSTSDKSLRAWDAADELLIKHFHESSLGSQPSKRRVLICNDAHGALSCALHAHNPISWSDSYLSHQALQHNWSLNGLAGAPNILKSTSSPDEALDLVLIKIPKTQALLDDQLAHIRPMLHEGSVIVATCMLKYLNRTAFSLFEKHIGSVSTSLAQKKARLLFCTLDQNLPVKASPYPDQYSDKDLDLTLLNHANVFCRDRVDLGSRFFIENLHLLPASSRVADLACGNGILGLCVQRSQPDSTLLFIDESYQAIASAKQNYANMMPTSGASSDAKFQVGDGLEQIEPRSLDLIVCNPPFHTQQALSSETTLSFTKAASNCLAAHGQLWVVANRHLPYKEMFKRHFQQLRIAAQNSRYIIYCASHPRH